MIFVEEVRNVPVGTVLKVDGAYALVDFSAKKNESGKRDIGSLLEDCRLVRKDELQVNISKTFCSKFLKFSGIFSWQCVP